MSTPQSYNKVDSASPLNAKDSAVKANIQALADLFPSAVQEGVVDFDALTRILGGKTEPQPERFGLNWCGKAAAHAGALVDSAGTLRPCREESKDWDTTKNLYIEGDNLEVLKLLRNSYRGKVKMIYIDPPYNTGKDFVYKDNFHDSIKNYQQITNQQNELKENSETCGRYHTDWLNMMYPRLTLARELLSEDGVIFISIDDNEFSNLKRICDEIFGESCYVGTLIRKILEGGKSDSKGIAIEHEYCHVYTKHDINGIYKKESIHLEHYNKKDEFFEERGYYYLKPLENGGLGYVATLDYPIIAPNGESVYPGGEHGDNGYRWVWGQDKFNKALKLGMIEFLHSQKDKGKYKVYYKIYEKVDTDGKVNPKTLPFNTFYLDGFTNRQGVLELKKLFECRAFDYPKPVSFINELCQMASKSNDLILDFFSGAASSAHAVMKLNSEDGGNRRFIMVQLPEPCKEESEAYKAGYKNICEIGKERIRRAGEKVKEEAGEKAEGLDIGFRVYKLDSSNVCAWDPDTKDIEKSLEQAANHLKEDRSAEDIMTELMLRFGIKLTDNIEKAECGSPAIDVYNIGCGRHFACLDERLAAHAEEVAHFILEWHKEENPGTHEEEAKDCQVFVVDKAFVGNDAAKKNFCAILSDYGIKQVNAF